MITVHRQTHSSQRPWPWSYLLVSHNTATPLTNLNNSCSNAAGCQSQTLGSPRCISKVPRAQLTADSNIQPTTDRHVAGFAVLFSWQLTDNTLQASTIHTGFHSHSIINMMVIQRRKTWTTETTMQGVHEPHNYYLSCELLHLGHSTNRHANRLCWTQLDTAGSM